MPAIVNTLQRIFFCYRKLLTRNRMALLIAIVLFLWLLVFGNHGVYELVKLMHLKTDLLTKQAKLKRNIEKLEEKEELLHNPSYLEMVIREELGAIKPGEVIFQEAPMEHQNPGPAHSQK